MMQDRSIVAKYVKQILFQHGEVNIVRKFTTLTMEVLNDIRHIPHDIEVTPDYFKIKLTISDDAGA